MKRCPARCFTDPSDIYSRLIEEQLNDPEVSLLSSSIEWSTVCHTICAVHISPASQEQRGGPEISEKCGQSEGRATVPVLFVYMHQWIIVEEEL